MAKKLKTSDVVRLLQAGLDRGKYAVAYFSRDRQYSYYTFDGISDIVDFMKKQTADTPEIDEKHDNRILFNIDEWFIFSTREMAYTVLRSILPSFTDENE